MSRRPIQTWPPEANDGYQVDAYDEGNHWAFEARKSGFSGISDIHIWAAIEDNGGSTFWFQHINDGQLA